ncbi:MAG: hypothetical protein LCH38_15215 [Proteobacteria bacterium]|nr:hypothetical protein [Pseudomonadota bacterium]
MKLVRNWRRVLARAWSARLALVNALVMAAGTYWFALANIVPPLPFFLIGIGLAIAPAVARIIRQEDLHRDP